MNENAPEWARRQRELRQLLRRSIEKYRQAYPKPSVGQTGEDAHSATVLDSCTILLPYLAYARWSGEADVKAWLYEWRDAYVEVMRENRGIFFHGFPVEGEAHHQWEDQSRFLSRLWFLDRDDPVNAYAVDDAAEHIGNFSPEVPPWYDFARHDFISYWFGTKKVAYRGGWDHPIWPPATPTPPTGIYREALYRVAQVAFNAYFATGKERYLEWTIDFLGEYLRRLDEKGADEDLVRIFAIEGWPAPRHTEFFTNNGWPEPSNRFIYGRYIPCLLTDLFALTGETRWADGARRFLEFCLPSGLSHWHQHYLFGLVQRYRQVTGDTQFDAAVLQAMEREIAEKGDYSADDYPFHLSGVQAMGYSKNRGPVARLLAYAITGDETQAVKALHQAVGIGKIVAERDPEEFVEGFATPHLAGLVDQKMATTLLSLSGWRPGISAHHIDVMDVQLFDEAGREGVPEEIALLCPPSPSYRRRVRLHNGGERSRTLRAVAGGIRGRAGAEATCTLTPGETVEITLEEA